MIHQPWGGTQGTASDISIQAEEILRIKKDINAILAQAETQKWLRDQGLEVHLVPGWAHFATVAALLVRGNLLLCIALQFLSTPLTAPVHLPICFVAGELVRGRGLGRVWQGVTEETSSLLSGDAAISLYLGSVVVGVLGGVIGYAVLYRTWRSRPVRVRS